MCKLRSKLDRLVLSHEQITYPPLIETNSVSSFVGAWNIIFFFGAISWTNNRLIGARYNRFKSVNGHTNKNHKEDRNVLGDLTLSQPYLRPIHEISLDNHFFRWRNMVKEEFKSHLIMLKIKWQKKLLTNNFSFLF